tara:strand:+ start:52371 stop:53177 length:807 start_codon:yes stop_codon:yes gene_type:complete
MQNSIFDKLWAGHKALCPSSHKIHALLAEKGESIENDHIALRTFRHELCGVDVLAEPFIKMGYVESGEYNFEAKKLYAKHYQMPNDPSAPKIFISELMIEHFSDELQKTIIDTIESVDPSVYKTGELVIAGRPWDNISYATYEKLREESEYAAWLYVYGYCANHFTVYVNPLKNFPTLESLNDFLEEQNFVLNSAGGKIKGTPPQLLEQSSILADKIDVNFTDGQHQIPGCYYEFARRYAGADGEIYQGFIAASADKIFESTDAKEQK